MLRPSAREETGMPRLHTLNDVMFEVALQPLYGKRLGAACPASTILSCQRHLEWRR